LADQKDSTYRLLWMLGLALTLPMILLSGPLAGYILSEFLLVKRLGMPEMTTPFLMVLGLVGSGIQVYRIIQKLRQSSAQK
jgi:uncharacterized membrane protein YqjE